MGDKDLEALVVIDMEIDMGDKDLEALEVIDMGVFPQTEEVLNRDMVNHIWLIVLFLNMKRSSL
jgi:hypothetical protein